MKVRRIRLRQREMIVWRGNAVGSMKYVRKHCAWPPAAADLGLTARLNSADRHHTLMYGVRPADLYDEAYIRACELDSPNSPDFDEMHERIYEELCEEWGE